MNHTSLRTISLSLLLLGLLLVAGCFATKLAIVTPDKAKMDKAFIGDWNSDSFDATGREAGMIVRNIDGKMFYAEFRQKGQKEIARAVGYLTDVKGATFAQLRGLEDDGSVAEDWCIMRLDLTGDTLKIRQLSEEFFKAQKFTTADQLRKVLEDNINTAAMYDSKEIITATRVKS